MARWCEPTPEKVQAYEEWARALPTQAARDLALRFDPWSLYRLKSTGHRVTIASYSADGTLTVNVTGQFNFVLHARRVFGIDPADLEPCDLPTAGELLGETLSPQEAEENIDLLRVAVRPDLWVLDEHGKAVRRQ